MRRLRIGARQPVESADGMTGAARAQIVAAGKLYDGEDRTPEQRFAEDDGSETSWSGYCFYAPVFDGEEIAYDAWFMMVDSGTFFRAGTTDAVAGIIQFGLECDDKALRDELGVAMVAAKLLPTADGSYAHFKALYDANRRPGTSTDVPPDS